MRPENYVFTPMALKTAFRMRWTVVRFMYWTCFCNLHSKTNSFQQKNKTKQKHFGSVDKLLQIFSLTWLGKEGTERGRFFLLDVNTSLLIDAHLIGCRIWRKHVLKRISNWSRTARCAEDKRREKQRVKRLFLWSRAWCIIIKLP